MPSNDVLINVESIWKQYGLRLPSNYYRLKKLLSFRQNNSNDVSYIPGIKKSEKWALKDISFKVEKGQALGIIGRNGSGKSTLLKVLSGVTPPTHGNVKVNGRIFPMIELNAGIHPELNGRENIKLLGAIMGFSRKEIEAKEPEIAEFTELGEWLDKPVRVYSSGMQARLGFGVAMNANADILLIDEVLATGDLAFQYKCLRRMEDLFNAGQGIVLVSHNMGQIARICNKVLILEEGNVIFDGNTEEAIKIYEKRSQEKQRANTSGFLNGNTTKGYVRRDFGQITLLDSMITSGHDEVTEIKSGEPLEVTFKINVHEMIKTGKINLVVYGVRAEPVTWHSFDLDDINPGIYQGKIQINQTWYVPGRWYDVYFDMGTGFNKGVLNVVIGSFFVTGNASSSRGYFQPPASWEWIKM